MGGVIGMPLAVVAAADRAVMTLMGRLDGVVADRTARVLLHQVNFFGLCRIRVGEGAVTAFQVRHGFFRPEVGVQARGRGSNRAWRGFSGPRQGFDGERIATTEQVSVAIGKMYHRRVPFHAAGLADGVSDILYL